MVYITQNNLLVDGNELSSCQEQSFTQVNVALEEAVNMEYTKNGNIYLCFTMNNSQQKIIG